MSIYKVKNLKELSERANKLQDFEYVAGGVDVQDRLNAGEKIGDFIDVSELKELKQIEQTKNYIEIGSLVTIAELLESNMIMPIGFKQGLQEIATPQIRNIATVGGNLMQKPAHLASDLCSSTLGLMLFAHEAEIEVSDGATVSLQRAFSQEFKNSKTFITKVRVQFKKGEKTKYFRFIERAHAEWPVVELYSREKNGEVEIAVGAIAPYPVIISFKNDFKADEAKKIIEKEIQDQSLVLENHKLQTLINSCISILIK